MNAQLEHQLRNLCAGFDGQVGLYARDLRTGADVGYQPDILFPTASAIKLPVLVTLMARVEAGEMTLEEPLMLRRADHIEGSGVLRYLTPGVTLPLRDWAFLMMRISDNVATNVIIDLVGVDGVNRWLADHGFTGVQLHHHLTLTAVRADQDHFGTATPRGLTGLLTAVFRRELVSPAACDEMLHMMDRVGEDRVGRYLPLTPFDADVPPADRLRLAGKTGSFVGTRVQTAVVWRGAWSQAQGFVLTVMSRGHPAPETWSVDAPGTLLIGRVARLLYDAVMRQP